MKVRIIFLFNGLMLMIWLQSCGDLGGNMINQPRQTTYQESEFFEDGSSARPIDRNTVARDDVIDPEKRPEITKELIQRGQEKFNIYCKVCHGRDGYGEGIVVQQGYPAPPSYHIDRLRNESDDHIFDVITNGLGKMRSQRSRVSSHERWAIIAYIRALQLSQYTPANLLGENEREKLNEQSREDRS